MITMPERMAQPESSKAEVLGRLRDTIGSDIRIAEPGIIESFDATKQTVTVAIALKERTVIDGNVTWEEIPTLLDVPIVFPRAGDYVLTFPIAAGDECLVIFGDKCMDAWWQNGGVQNPMELRRHDLSDGYAILGCWSQPNVIPDYSGDTVQLRSLDGATYYEIDGGTLNIVGNTLNITVDLLNIVADTISAVSGTALDLKAAGATTIEDVNFLLHKHTNVKTGYSNSGPVVAGGGGGGGKASAVDFNSFFCMG